MILICDNSPEHIDWLIDYLGKDEVTTALNLNESLEYLKDNIYDLVLVNMDMGTGDSIIRLCRILNYFPKEVIGYSQKLRPELEGQNWLFKYATTSRPYDFKKAIQSLSLNG